jgi:hypothetical protein
VEVISRATIAKKPSVVLSTRANHINSIKSGAGNLPVYGYDEFIVYSSALYGAAGTFIYLLSFLCERNAEDYSHFSDSFHIHFPYSSLYCKDIRYN